MAAKGDLDSLKLFFYAGIKDLNKYVNVDKRSVAHVVSQFKIFGYKCAIKGCF